MIGPYCDLAFFSREVYCIADSKTVTSYSLLPFEQLNYLHPGILRLMKDYTVNFLSPNNLTSGRVRNRRKIFPKIRGRVVSGYCLLLSTRQNDDEL